MGAAAAGELGTEAVFVEGDPPPQPAIDPAASSKSAGRHTLVPLRIRETAPPFKTLLFILARRLSALPKAQRNRGAPHLTDNQVNLMQLATPNFLWYADPRNELNTAYENFLRG